MKPHDVRCVFVSERPHIFHRNPWDNMGQPVSWVETVPRVPTLSLWPSDFLLTRWPRHQQHRGPK